jgi:hypothetical protein
MNCATACCACGAVQAVQVEVALHAVVPAPQAPQHAVLHTLCTVLQRLAVLEQPLRIGFLQQRGEHRAVVRLTLLRARLGCA